MTAGVKKVMHHRNTGRDNGGHYSIHFFKRDSEDQWYHDSVIRKYDMNPRPYGASNQIKLTINGDATRLV